MYLLRAISLPREPNMSYYNREPYEYITQLPASQPTVEYVVARH